MRKLISIVISICLIITLSISLFSCGNSSSGESGPPTNEQWEKAGVTGGFTVEVDGTLESSVAENGEISMKWSESNEKSLDNTITWLKEQGYSLYNGQIAQKTSSEGGKIISYTAEKTITSSGLRANGNTLIVTPVAYDFSQLSTESKTMIADAYFIKETVTIGEITLLAGELYLDIYEQENGTQSGLLNEWPASQIQNAIGESVPSFTGAQVRYNFVNESIGSQRLVAINVYGATENELSAYTQLLTQNGYVENSDIYTKALENGNLIEIVAYISQGYNPETFEIENVAYITIMLVKSSGEHTSWNSLDLSVFAPASIPAYNGGTSFDLDNIGAETIKGQQNELNTMIEMLEAYEHLLDEETRLELEYYKTMLSKVYLIEAYVITVYGTNENEAYAYEDALYDAGFEYGEKETSEYIYTVEIDEEDGKALISIQRMPIEFVQDYEGDVGGEIEDDELDWNDLPENLRVRVESGLNGATSLQYTYTKIGNDWLIEDISGIKIFLKHQNNSWTEYVLSSDQWISGTSYSNLYESSALLTLSFIFDNYISGYTKGETEEVAGQVCDVYTLFDDSLASYGMTSTDIMKLNSEGFTFYNYSETDISGFTSSSREEITIWDTTVSGFDIDVVQ